MTPDEQFALFGKMAFDAADLREKLEAKDKEIIEILDALDAYTSAYRQLIESGNSDLEHPEGHPWTPPLAAKYCDLSKLNQLGRDRTEIANKLAEVIEMRRRFTVMGRNL